MDILALSLNFIGAFILAVSTGSFFKWISLCLNAHEISIQTMLSPGDVINPSGTTIHLDHTLKSEKKWMILGVVLIIAGFGIQLYAAIVKYFS